jgi:hypothetical protein
VSFAPRKALRSVFFFVDRGSDLCPNVSSETLVGVPDTQFNLELGNAWFNQSLRQFLSYSTRDVRKVGYIDPRACY